MKIRFSVYMAVSLDGFIARRDGGLDWLDSVHVPGEDYGYQTFFDGVDALVLGSGTYKSALSFPQWPYGGKRCIIVTGQTRESKHGEEFFSGSPRELALKLEADGFKKVYLDGGMLIRAFWKEGLVGDWTLSIVPVLLGSGIPLFENGLPETALKLLGVQGFPSGLVQVRYETANLVSRGGGTSTTE